MVLVNGPNLVIFDSERFDSLGEYDVVTGLFTARRAGYYSAESSLYVNNPGPGSPFISAFLMSDGVVTPAVAIAHDYRQIYAAMNNAMHLHALYHLKPGDVVYVVVFAVVPPALSLGDAIVDRTHFSIQRVS